ncbi:MAG: hypothetical protein IJV43_09345 [Oscillospiraceae bacterium]|nr:hypothetical protein [Oscillospiraceae bacterium]
MSLSKYDSGQLAQAALLVPEYQSPDQSYLLASSLDELRRSNDAAESQTGGELTRIGLRLVPDAFDDGAISGVRVSELSRLAPEIRQLRRITVRGCFVRGKLDGLHGRELGRFFRACYESAKQMTVSLPCAMPYLCVEGGLTALAYNQAEHRETLREAITAAQIVAMQNQTAFYAKLLIT